MEYYGVSLVELAVFSIFLCLEQARPLKQQVAMTWMYYRHLVIVVLIGLAMFAGFRHLSLSLPSPSPVKFTDGVTGVLLFYIWYSFCNYWWHRCKHNYLWWVHRLHHAPQRLTTSLALFRSPIEIVLNLVFLFVIGRVLTDPHAWG